MKIGGQNISFGARREYLISVMFHFSNNFEHRSLFKANFEHLRSKWLFQHLKVFIGHSLEHYFALKKTTLSLINDIVPQTSIHVILFHVFFPEKGLIAEKQAWKLACFITLKHYQALDVIFLAKKTQQNNKKNGVLNTSFGARREYLISAMFNFSNNFEHKSPFKPNFELLRSKWLFRHLKVFIGHSLKTYFAWKNKTRTPRR